MEARNPYAVSSASFHQRDDVPASTEQVDVWRDGKTLVMRPNAHLPPRCVKCNEPCEFPMKPRKVYWHHWAVYLLLPLNVLLYAVVGMIVRRKAEIAPGLCRKHRTQRTLLLTAAWLMMLGGLAGMFWAGFNDSPDSIGLWLLLMIVGIVASVFSRVVRATHISPEYVRLRGCKPIFLDALPPFRG